MKRRVWIFFLVMFVSQLFSLNMECGADTNKVLMVIAHEDFRDEEFKAPFEALIREGYEVVVASSTLGTAQGMLGMSVNLDTTLSSVSSLDYDAVIFVGGVGAQGFWDDVDAQELAKSMLREDKLVAAICIAPVILANAGILEGKKATVWESESYRLESKGALYSGESVEVDGNIITADGPFSSQEFADEIINKLKE